MAMIQGECKYCGQLQNIDAETKEEADQKATEMCECDQAAKEKQHKVVIQRIDQICHASSQDTGFTPIDDDTYKLVCILADKIIDEELEFVKIELSDRILSISKTTKGVVKFRQKKTVEVGIDG